MKQDYVELAARQASEKVLNNAWEQILNQIEAFQIKMKEFRIDSVIADCSRQNFFDVLHGLVKNDTQQISLENYAFGPGPDDIRLSLAKNQKPGITSEQLEVIREDSSDNDVTMEQASMTIFSNIFNYVNFLEESREDFSKYTSSLNVSGEISVGRVFENDHYEACKIPGITNTLRQLTGWVDREADRFKQDLTERFDKILQNTMLEINQTYPGLNLIAHLHGEDDVIGFDNEEDIEFTFIQNEEQIVLNSQNIDQCEKTWPGLEARLKEIMDCVSSINRNIGIINESREIDTPFECSEPDI